MKIPILLLALCASVFAQEQPPEEIVSKMIRIEVLIARVPTAKAIGLQKELRDPKTIQRGIEKLLGMIEKNQAELIDWPCLTTKSGSRAVVENIREIRYPIEFEIPHVLPDQPVNPDVKTVPNPTAPPDAPAATGTPAGAVPAAEGSAPKQAEEKGPIKMGGAGPTSFETRNVGVTLEVEPTIMQDGATIEMSIAPQHVSLLGYRREVFELTGQYEVAVQQPIFENQKTQTSLALKNGGSHLLAFFNLKEPKNTVELFILTGSILEIKGRIPAPKPEAADALQP